VFPGGVTFRLTRFQTIDPAQFAAYNSVECVILLTANALYAMPNHTYYDVVFTCVKTISVGSVFKLTVHAEPDLGLGVH
jgi:hypothetical protein